MENPDLPPIEVLKDSLVNTIQLGQLLDSDIYDDQKYIKAQIDFIHVLDKDIITTGVNTKEHLDLLQNLGCDYVLGEAISMPLEGHALVDFISKCNHSLSSKAI